MAEPKTEPQKSPEIIGKGQAPTNTTPLTHKAVELGVPVKVTFRFFPANVTAELEGHKPQLAKSLNGLPFVVGTVQGNTLTPLQPKLLRLGGGSSTPGKISGGVFCPLTAKEAAAWLKAHPDPKKKGASLPLPTHLHHETLVYTVKPGTTVGICIAVDAKAKFRKYPLWQVTAKANDIVVDVFETFGKALGLQEKVGAPVTRNEGTEKAPKHVDYYGARLTGDTWMRSTHKFTSSDVDAIPKARATDAMKQALKRIYAGDFDAVGKEGNFAIGVPRKLDDKDTASVQLVWRAGDNGNCKDNIASLNVKQDVPSRINPEAYAAAAKAAHDAGIERLEFSSSWRPMLGSMPHRLGLGLDLVYLHSGKEGANLNRVGLLKDKGKRQVNDRAKNNLPKEELDAYDDWQAKVAEQDKAEKELKSADKVLKDALGAKAKIKNPAPETTEKLNKAVEEATARQKEAQKAQVTTQKAAREAKNTWGEEVKKHEPGPVGNYRRYVMHGYGVTQVLDPWYLVGLATHKAGELVPNEQVGERDLAKMHNNHMHLSIRDEELFA
jgi:hypothetical protein